jgi:predicted lipoprotein with Yx(FWY)xxD motif
MNRSSPLALAALAALLVTGCGSASKTSTSSSVAPAAATTSATSASVAAGVSVTVVNVGGKLGSVLAAGASKHTVYLFEADHGATSACTGACAQAWPPVTTSRAPSATAGALAADLGTITRADGTKQVTYKGHPLYFFSGDSGTGKTTGEGSKAFGAGWYVLAPNGNKIDLS